MAVSSDLPCGVLMDTKGRERPRGKDRSASPDESQETTVSHLAPKYQFKLLFRQRCPKAADVLQIHPGIQSVFVPSRPASVRYCIVKFTSAEKCEEVRSALHGKHIEPFLGKLKCIDTTSNTLSKFNGSEMVMDKIKHKRLHKSEVKLVKIVMNKDPTEDVKQNSTARELFVRYGVICSSKKKGSPGKVKNRKEGRPDKIKNSQH